jgi:hypothetical protein
MSKTYSVHTADKELARDFTDLAGAKAYACSQVRQRNAAVSVNDSAGHRVAGPFVPRHLTTVDARGRAVECYTLARLVDERLGTEHAPPVTPPAVRWLPTRRGYQPGEIVQQAGR